MLQITIFDKFPKDWDLVGLEDFVNSNSGIKPGPFGSSITKDCYTKFGYRVYGQEQVIAGDLSVGDYFISKAKFRELHSFAVQANDILLSLVGTVGKILVVREPFHPGIINPRLIRLRPHYQTNTQYLKHLLESSIVRYQLNKIAQGGTMEVLSATVLRQLRLPKPQLPEQQKIAEILDAIDQAIALTDTHITKLKKAKAGLLHDLLTRGIDDHGELRDYTRNPELFKQSPLGIIPKDWDIETIKQCIKTIEQGWSPDCESFRAEPGEWGVLKTTSVVWEGYQDIENKRLPSNLSPRAHYEVKPGDVLITRAGPNSRVGVVALVRNTQPKLILSDKLYRLVPNEKIRADFLTYALSSNQVQSYLSKFKTGLAESQTNISQAIILNLYLPLPPVDEQEKIAKSIEIKDLKILQREKYLEKLKLLKKGLMSDLLTGRVRVKI
ncbi:restriction endonuclease subunit S [Aulosira sp. FACHB-615]|uniref:restriction endonuclease subunit S n=1 Tax=Aulosira sp. FACHB-615 TaxID=2692777 RepID=UPI00168520F2|nr:restriction endonuclease subunit S [Aulosira sp. FACHB-615]MBD2490459.1 restriction endonuclease subunit S [Aulosira sp. FACHB-615]